MQTLECYSTFVLSEQNMKTVVNSSCLVCARDYAILSLPVSPWPKWPSCWSFYSQANNDNDYGDDYYFRCYNYIYNIFQSVQYVLMERHEGVYSVHFCLPAPVIILHVRAFRLQSRHQQEEIEAPHARSWDRLFCIYAACSLWSPSPAG